MMLWRQAGARRAGAGFVLVMAGLVSWYSAAAHKAPPDAARGVPLPTLGNEAACKAYAGLPPGWRQDAHAGMVALPAGRFQFGSTKGYPDERPASAAPVRMAGFWIDQTEVTVAQFAAFVAATGYVTEAERQGGGVVFSVPTPEQLQQRPLAWWQFVAGADWRHPGGPGSDQAGRDALPVSFVTQADALAYAHWLGRDLPTEAEWEYAAKAGQQADMLDDAPRDATGKPTANYWQGSFPILNLHEDGHEGLAPVGCYPANAWGLHDTIGNVWEWTRDAYSGPHRPHMNGDTAAVAGAQHKPSGPTVSMVIKGGSFLCAPDFCVRYRASARESQEADLATAHIGFRTVLRAP
ncbi:SUMF1/EgtB/PvdO family nonheme iron enzyme [Ideonella sp.]|uniref:SUMF1/EgtB/PvdO family nonheme iron enzyme n=1 Tax=Ideonella sp. TaxID=1929293 RepID=UPI00351B5C27